MRCDEIQPQLSAFTDSELTRIAAWSVRHHLSRCAECRAIQSDLTAISRSAREYCASNLAPESLGATFLAEADQTLPLPRVTPRRELRRMAAAISVAAALIGFIVGGASLYFSVQSTPAFAEVTNALRSAPFHTIHMKGIMGQFDGSAGPLLVDEVWARTQRPASVTIMHERGRTTPSKTTESMERMVYRYNFQGKAWKYVRANPVWHRSIDAYTREWIVSRALAPNIDSDRKFHWTQTNIVRAGKRLIRLDGTRNGWFLKPSDTASMTLFADPQTHFLVRSERHFMIDGHDCFMIWTNITYNETPPPHTFDDADKPNLP